ncbi:hypothetical protein HELRODRAFT_175204 [Helobdella robusta]|uniref:Uncharacterized protein n=1 Tax=Helobdella robusta TaxID=6412 RepID=T1F901_HELRO|nr:hypothetical protein HELRODRAFT_175204 [Helobdella robusta]ESO01176.1 hypothetical protein HELRODRAFT_175204 [Helobdella robusta]
MRCSEKPGKKELNHKNGANEITSANAYLVAKKLWKQALPPFFRTCGINFFFHFVAFSILLFMMFKHGSDPSPGGGQTTANGPTAKQFYAARDVLFAKKGKIVLTAALTEKDGMERRMYGMKYFPSVARLFVIISRRLIPERVANKKIVIRSIQNYFRYQFVIIVIIVSINIAVIINVTSSVEHGMICCVVIHKEGIRSATLRFS